MDTITIPVWIPAALPQPNVDRLLERQWRRKADLRYYRRHGRWPERLKA
jgi:hypothetical protein